MRVTLSCFLTRFGLGDLRKQAHASLLHGTEYLGETGRVYWGVERLTNGFKPLCAVSARGIETVCASTPYTTLGRALKALPGIKAQAFAESMRKLRGAQEGAQL